MWRWKRVLLLVVFLLLGATVQAQTLTPLPNGWSSWLAENAVAVMILAFHIGVSWREFVDHRKRIEGLEDALSKNYVNRETLQLLIQTAVQDALKPYPRT